VLIDTGAGALFGPNNGKMLGNLKAAGYQPEQVDEVYITHFHVDHVGGLSANGQIVFPNAIVRADKRDPEFWLSQENLDKAPDNVKPFFKGAQVSVGPYVQAGKLQPFDGSTDLIPGIKAIATPGHTVGHTSYLVESNGQKLVVWGDLVHVGAAQFANPSITIKYDTDPKAAAEQRKQAFAQAAQEGYLVGAPHVAFPGLGHLRTEGSGYQFIPVNYSVPH
jgi:glyoxylase-like metal-dependent hydrolase (beta-lactamase superfamily II)